MRQLEVLAEPPSAAEAVPRPADGGRSAAVAVAGPALLALVLSLLLAGRPSYWLDETATVSAVDRPFPDLLRLLRNVDAVHGAYYTLLWPWAQVSTAESWLRLPSAFAAAGAAAAVAGIGWQVFGRRTAVLGGLLFATLPLTSYDGANARSPALSVALVAGATFFLLRATASGRRRWAVAYTLTMAAASAVFLFGALAMLAHALHVGLAGGAWRSPRRLLRRLALFVLPTLAALVVAVPANRQSGQVGWIRRPTLGGLPELAAQAWFSDDIVLAVVVGLLAVGGMVMALTRRSGTRPAGTAALVTLLVAPTAVLWVVSQVDPLLDDRYLGTATIPLALFAGHLVAVLPRQRLTAPLLVSVVVLAGLQPQVLQRQSAGRGDGYRDDPRAALAAIGAERRAGDAVSFPDSYPRGATVAYPESVRGLSDVSLGVDRITGRNLYGYGVDRAVFAQRVSQYRRVWMVTFPVTNPVTQRDERAALENAGFARARSTSFGRTALELWTR